MMWPRGRRLLSLLGCASALAPPLRLDSLTNALRASDAGRALAEEDALRLQGRGSPHRSSKLRLFDAVDDFEPRVVLYRDSAAWCPYCQKLWMMLEEKEVPYRVELINMRSYGDKPASYMRKVQGGILPALELDGAMYTESLDIMAMIDAEFAPSAGHRAMLPPRDSLEFQKVRQLLQMERSLFRSWCDYVFRGGFGSKGAFERDLDAVDAELGASAGPWFLESEGPTIVDLQYVSHVERMAASVAFWKGEQLRGGRWANLDRWFEAFEQRDSYAATRSDWYTHAFDIPPQYGAGVASRSPAQQKQQKALEGADSAWRLPLPPLASSAAPSDALQPGWDSCEQTAPAEAAHQLLRDFEAVASFASRAKGKAGGWAFGRPDRSQLADPQAKPATGDARDDAAVALLLTAQILVDGCEPTDAHARQAQDAFQHLSTQRKKDAAECCAYLRDRVGVPRDMSYPAARCLRASLNWTIDKLQAA